MNNTTLIITLVIAVTGLLFILIILLLVKFGILGSKEVDVGKTIQFNDGKNIENGISSEIGLKGFYEDHSRTIVVNNGYTKSQRVYDIEFSDVQNGQLYIGKLRNQLVVGRKGEKEDTFLEIPHKSVSRRHLLIIQDNNSIYACDLGSKNHTRINGKLMQPGNYELVYSGDKLRLGVKEYQITIR